jgi:hypothetical protein
MTSVARIAVFAALALGANFPFLVIPSVEVISVTLFWCGLFLGWKHGMASAFLAGIIFVYFNPNGPQPIILVGLAQITGFVTYALFGGLFRKFLLNNDKIINVIITMTALGAVLTLLYDTITNIMFAITIGPFWVVLIGGLSFAVAHIISNTIIFGFSGVLVNKVWKRLEQSLPPV